MSDTPRTDKAWNDVLSSGCLPKCDSFAHEELCPYCNGDRVMYEFARQLERENAALRETAKAVDVFLAETASMPVSFSFAAQWCKLQDSRDTLRQKGIDL